MAISQNNPLLKQLSGAIGKLLVIKNYGHKTVVAKRPNMCNVVPSKKQASQRLKFQDAQLYAKAVISDPVRKESYLAKLKPNQNVYHAAISDYMANH